jgi:hypothetical protein
MQNANKGASRDDRTKIDAVEMETLRVLPLRILDRGQEGSIDIRNEVDHFLAALSTVDRNSVCFVSNFIAVGHQNQVEDISGGDPDSALLTTYGALQTRLIPWLEGHGYERHSNHWRI